MDVSLKNFTSLICSTFCQIIIFFIPTHFYKIYILIRMQFVHGKQCTSKDRNFNRQNYVGSRGCFYLTQRLLFRISYTVKLLSPKL